MGCCGFRFKSCTYIADVYVLIPATLHALLAYHAPLCCCMAPADHDDDDDDDDHDDDDDDSKAVTLNPKP